MGLGLAFEAKVLEVRVGLALRHVAPAAFAKQALHEGVHISTSQVVRDVADLLESLEVVFLDRLGPPLQIAKGMVAGLVGALLFLFQTIL